MTEILCQYRKITAMASQYNTTEQSVPFSTQMMKSCKPNLTKYLFKVCQALGNDNCVLNTSKYAFTFLNTLKAFNIFPPQ